MRIAVYDELGASESMNVLSEQALEVLEAYSPGGGSIHAHVVPGSREVRVEGRRGTSVDVEVHRHESMGWHRWHQFGPYEVRMAGLDAPEGLPPEPPVGAVS